MSRQSERRILFAAQRGICASCGITMLDPDRGAQHPLGATTDHVVPKWAGGRNNFSNKVAMHRCCNHLKAGRMPNGCELVWREMIRAKVPQPERLAA